MSIPKSNSMLRSQFVRMNSQGIWNSSKPCGDFVVQSW